MSIRINRIGLPPLIDIPADEVGLRLKPGDIVLCGPANTLVGRTIRWGQFLMLRQFGYDDQTCDALAPYVHAVTVTSVPCQVIEARLPDVAYCDIGVDYAGHDLLVLRARDLTLEEIARLSTAMESWLGTSYDWKEYLVYPFYMAWGWVAGWWRKLWDDPKKPVCSGLCIDLYQDALGMLTDIPKSKIPEYPPARLPLLPELKAVARLRLSASARSKTAQIRPLPPGLKNG